MESTAAPNSTLPGEHRASSRGSARDQSGSCTIFSSPHPLWSFQRRQRIHKHSQALALWFKKLHIKRQLLELCQSKEPCLSRAGRRGCYFLDNHFLWRDKHEAQGKDCSHATSGVEQVKAWMAQILFQVKIPHSLNTMEESKAEHQHLLAKKTEELRAGLC